MAQIAASIAEFGWTNPVFVGADGVVIAGHARLMAARKLSLAEVPVIVLDHLTEAGGESRIARVVPGTGGLVR